MAQSGWSGEAGRRRGEKGRGEARREFGGNSEETISVVGELERGGAVTSRTHRAQTGREDMDEERRRERGAEGAGGE